MIRTVASCLQGRENNFDFIRFCAALAVMFAHSFDLTQSTKDPLYAFSSGKATFGTLAVAIFFIISGILISQSFDRSADLYTFLKARILRIYPALIVVVLICVFVVGTIFTTLSLADYFTNWYTWRFMVNMLAIKIQFFLPGVFEHNVFPRSVNGSLWTLPVEMGCYGLVAAVGLYIKKKYRLSTLFFLVVAALYGKTLVDVNTYYFALGVLIYIYREKISLNGILAIVSFVVFLGNQYLNPNLASANIINGFALAYFLLYVGFLKNDSVKNFSRNGDFSYGLYIYAFPVQQVVSLKLPDLNPYQHVLLCVPITLSFAYLSWHLVEKQALRLKKKA